MQSKEVLNIRRAVLAEVKRYPKLEIQDLYKLAYQAAMGNEHIMNDTADLQKSLNDDLAAVDAISDEPLLGTSHPTIPLHALIFAYSKRSGEIL